MEKEDSDKGKKKDRRWINKKNESFVCLCGRKNEFFDFTKSGMSEKKEEKSGIFLSKNSFVTF